jgi:ATP-dependent 26S proteasome regulatory subunit
VREAGIIAIRKHKDSIGMAEINEAMERIDMA